MDTSEDEVEAEEVAVLSGSIEKPPDLLGGNNGRHTVELPGQEEVWHEPCLISSADLDGCEGSTARLEDVDFDDLAG